MTGSRASVSMLLIGGESVAGADRRLADSIAKSACQRVQGAPSGTVAGDDVLDAERLQRSDGLGNNAFHDPAQVQPPHHAMYRDIRKQILHLRADIDDAGMRTGAEYDQAQIAHMSD